MSFINKVVLITGAGSGIGAATAIHFAKISARLSLIDANPEDLKKSAETCEKITKTKVLKLTTDYANDEDLKKAVEGTVKEYGKIDVVVNCAEICSAKNILDTDLMEDYDRVMAVNLRAVVAVMHFAAAALIESKGCVINISSNTANLAVTDVLPFVIGKAALCHLTRCVALELSAKGVRVNAVLPSPVRDSQGDGFSRKREGLSPLQRTVKSEEVATVVAYLASDKAASITGVNYVIDSGTLLTGFKPIRL